MIIEKREVVLLSDHRILYLIKNDLFGGWQLEWTNRWIEISTIRATDRGVEILLKSGKEGGNKKFSLFGSSEALKKLLLIPQKERRNQLALIMDNLKMKDSQ